MIIFKILTNKYLNNIYVYKSKNKKMHASSNIKLKTESIYSFDSYNSQSFMIYTLGLIYKDWNSGISITKIS